MASGDTKTGQLLDALENGGDISNIVGCCNTNLQNYLIESIDSVNDAKEEIAEKGGTVGDTGLSGLASEIASIPAGGDEPVTAYGKLTYYYDVRSSYGAQGMMCSVVVTDMDAYAAFYESAFGGGGGGMPTIRYENGEWFYEDFDLPDDPRVVIPDITAIGLSVTFDDPETPFAEIMCSKSSVVYPESGTKSVIIEDLATYQSLTGEEYTVGDEKIYYLAVVSYEFGPDATSVPDYFLNSSSVSMVNADKAPNLTSIGNNLYWGKTIYINFPEVTSIGDSVRLNGEVNFPKVQTIGNNMEFISASKVMLPALTSVGQGFRADKALEVGMPEVLSIGNNFSAIYAYWIYWPKVKTIGAGCLKNLTPSTLYLNINSVETIGKEFLSYGKYSFIYQGTSTPGYVSTQALVLLSHVTSIAGLFMFSSANFRGVISVACPASVCTGDSLGYLCAFETSSSVSEVAPIFKTGFTITGTQRSSWGSKFQSLTASYGTADGFTGYYYRFRQQAN